MLSVGRIVVSGSELVSEICVTDTEGEVSSDPGPWAFDVEISIEDACELVTCVVWVVPFCVLDSVPVVTRLDKLDSDPVGLTETTVSLTCSLVTKPDGRTSVDPGPWVAELDIGTPDEGNDVIRELCWPV